MALISMGWEQDQARQADAAPAISFEHGALWITHRGEMMRIRAWPQPEAQLRSNSRDWELFCPALRLVKPGPDGDAHGPTRKEVVFGDLRDTIPGEILPRIEVFRSHQWALLELAHERPEFLDLLQANPVLAFCLANNQEFRTMTALTPATQARWHVHKKQRDILDWLGFPGTKAHAKLLSRIQPEAANPADLRMLRTALRNEGPVRKLISHLPAVNAGVLRLATSSMFDSALTPALLADVAAADEEMTYPHAADTLVEVGYLLSALGQRRILPPIHSRAQAAELRVDLEARLRVTQEREARERRVAERLRLERRQNREDMPRRRPPVPSFPNPPVPGNSNIIPLLSAQELEKEGRSQRHCVGAYAPDVREGRTYVYKVLQPQRATLCIRLCPDSSWQVSQLRLARNAAVSSATRAAVDRWLDKHRLSV